MTVREKLDKYPLFDIPVLWHGFADYMRDYELLVEAKWSEGKGRYRYCFTHCVEARVQTGVKAETWKHSWDDTFIDYDSWIEANEPEGSVWGVRWSMAYPGIQYNESSPEAAMWTKRLGREMHTITMETGAYRLELVFHGIWVRKVGDDSRLLDRVFIPLYNK